MRSRKFKGGVRNRGRFESCHTNYIKHVVNDVAELEESARVVKLKNVFSCEAHNELIKDTLRLLYDGKLDEAKELIDCMKQLQNPEI